WIKISRNLLLVFWNQRSVRCTHRAWPSPAGRLPGASEDLVMAEDRLHVVFGTGQVGTALAAHLAGLGLAVRAVSRHRPPALAAAERSGALLVGLENVYGYGPAGGKPMTEDLPLAATTVKGRTRAAMTAELLAAADAGRVRVAIGRASDFFGPGVTQGSVLGERVFG